MQRLERRVLVRVGLADALGGGEILEQMEAEVAQLADFH